MGPGLPESVYEAVLADALERKGLRVDLMVENRLIIELKSVERLSSVHAKQLLTYLLLAKQPLGLLMNFDAATFREGCSAS